MVTRKTTAKTAASKAVAQGAPAKAAPGKTAPRKTAPRKPASKTSATSLPMAVPAPLIVVVPPALSEPAPANRPKLVRDSFTMPKNEYALLDAMKGRLLLMSKATKKSELIRAGIVALAALSDDDLLKAVARVPYLQTGRPKKSKNADKGDRKKS